jgi:hypothetical protein
LSRPAVLTVASSATRVLVLNPLKKTEAGESAASAFAWLEMGDGQAGGEQISDCSNYCTVGANSVQGHDVCLASRRKRGTDLRAKRNILAFFPLRKKQSPPVTTQNYVSRKHIVQHRHIKIYLLEAKTCHNHF